MIREELRGPADAGEALGDQLAETILQRGGRAILDMAYRDCR